MAEGEEGGDARAPPVRLWVRRIGVYCDENQKTWLVAPEEEAGTLKARIRRVQVPLGEAVRPSRLPASHLPHMWQLSEGQQYRDSNFRIWDIEHHLLVRPRANHSSPLHYKSGSNQHLAAFVSFTDHGSGGAASETSAKRLNPLSPGVMTSLPEFYGALIPYSEGDLGLSVPSANNSLGMPLKDPCQKQACEIQKCLQANNYMESKCEAVLQEMRKCCSRYPPGRSICCSGFELEEKERQKSASEGTQGPHT